MTRHDGLCECGCGQKTSVPSASNRSKGWVKGQPLRWVSGHSTRKSGVDFIEDAATHCWIWQLAVDPAGYGVAWNGKKARAHRVVYENLIGAIPEGKVLDHLCRTPACVNPGHLEPVTNCENILRGESPSALNARKTHCPRGHAYEGENVVFYRGRRFCRTCRNAAAKDYQRRKRAEAKAA